MLSAIKMWFTQEVFKSCLRTFVSVDCSTKLGYNLVPSLSSIIARLSSSISPCSNLSYKCNNKKVVSLLDTNNNFLADDIRLAKV